AGKHLPDTVDEELAETWARVAKPVVKVGGTVRRGHGRKWKTKHGLVARQRFIADLLIPRAEMETFALRPAAAAAPPVVKIPVFGAGGDMDNHVIHQVRQVEMD